MPGILDRVAAQRYNEFRPQTVREFFALQLARKLGDHSAARHYHELVEEHSEEGLLVAYRRALAASGDHWGTLARNFHSSLTRVNGHGPSIDAARLLAIKIERRTVSAAVFLGRHPEDTETRHLSSVRAKAAASAVSFIQWLTNNFEIESAAIECVPANRELRRSTLHKMIIAVLRERMLPISEVPKSQLIASFGHPEPTSRREMREVTQSIWPVLETDTGILDAVSLGLYLQTERLFASQT
jgi:hypothetical protein